MPKLNIDPLELDELIAVAMKLDYEKTDIDEYVIDRVQEDPMGLLQEYTSNLMAMIEVGQTPLTNKLVKGFAKDSVLYAKMEWEQPVDVEYANSRIAALGNLTGIKPGEPEQAIIAAGRSVEALAITKTPSALWRAQGQPDPHADSDYYDGERAKLCRGDLTDDQLANVVYLDSSIGNLTAAKERIRWLSRALEKALAPPTAPYINASLEEFLKEPEA